MKPVLGHCRYAVLLGWILVTVLVVPVLQWEGPGGRWLVLLVFTGFLAAALNAVADTRRARAAVVGTAFVALVASWLTLADDSVGLLCARHGGAAAFSAIVVGLLLRRVLARGRVTGERVTAAICAYLMLGLLWSGLYALVLLWRPDAFLLPAGDAGHTLTYFSFVTLTTLGYGDVTPVHPLARSLAFLEAATGALYLAVLVARLVALQIAHELEDPDA